MATAAARPLTGDEVIILSREIQAMIAAGVPLDFGLRSAGQGMDAPLQSISERLAARIDSGHSLDEALREESSVPPVYRAVLIAGLRCGRSDEVLEELTEMTIHLTRLKQSLYHGLIYPATICVLGLLMLAGLVRSFVPTVIELYRSLPVQPPAILTFLSGFPALPLAFAILALVAVGLFIASRTGGQETIVAGLSWLPGTGRIIRDVRIARLAHTLGLLVKYGTPLPEALRLTAGTVSAKTWQNQLMEMADSVEEGHSLSAALNRERGIPTFLKWLVAIGSEESVLCESLEQAAEIYRERAYRRGEFLKRVIPATVMIVIGGTITLLYALTVFLPMTTLWAAIGHRQ